MDLLLPTNHRAKTLYWFALFLTACVAPPATAAAQTISLQDCIRLAELKNQRLVSAAQHVRAAEQVVHEAKTNRLPAVDFHAGASFAPLGGFDPALTDGGDYAALAEIQQTVFDGGVNRLNRKQADLTLQLTRQAKQRTIAEVSRTATSGQSFSRFR